MKSLSKLPQRLPLYVRSDSLTYRPATRDQILAEARRLAERRLLRRRRIRHPADATPLLRDLLQGLEYESFVVLFLDSACALIACEEMFRGSVNSIVVPVWEIARQALRHNATQLIVAHNHPAGSVEPSTEDLQLTERLQQVLALIDVRLLDHIIVGAGGAAGSLAVLGRL